MSPQISDFAVSELSHCKPAAELFNWLLRTFFLSFFLLLLLPPPPPFKFHVTVAVIVIGGGGACSC